MDNWYCIGLGWTFWKEAWQMKMGLSCCTAFTEHNEKLVPVRICFTWYKTGISGFPAGVTRDTVGLSEPHRPCHHPNG